MSRYTTIFLLPDLGFILTMEKSILNPVQEMERLGLTVNSVKMTLSQPEERVKLIQDQCQDLHVKGFETVLELTKLKGLLAATTEAVLSAQLNFQYLQQQQINALKLKGSYQEVLYLNKESRKEIQWWIENMKLCNDRLIIQHQPYALCYTESRCLPEWVGCILPRDSSRREMDIRGKGNAHNYFGIEGIEVSFNVISHANKNESSSFLN